MKNIIVQVFIDKKGWEEEHRLNAQSKEVLILSNILVRNYAKIVNADYKLINKPVIKFKHPTWERFQIFEDQWINSYDNILYLDTDVFTWPNSPNIFDFINNNSLNTVTHCNNKLFNGSPMFNAGVFAINKTCALEMRKFFRKDLWLKSFEKDHLWEDSKELNNVAQKARISRNWLDPLWNMKNIPDAYFTHLWGNQKKFSPNMPSINKAKIFAKKIIEESKELSKSYKIEKN